MSLAPYYGGKSIHAAWINSLLPEKSRVYVEPFGGMASVLIARRKPLGGSVEVYNDVNEVVVNVFRVLQDPEKYEELVHRMKWTLRSKKEYERAIEVYYDPPSDVESAWALLVNLLQSFSGVPDNGWRRPFLRKDEPSIVRTMQSWPDQAEGVRQRFMDVVIEHDSWDTIVDRYDKHNALFYMDPPYMGSARVVEEAYDSEMNSEREHEQLLMAANAMEGAVAISGYETDLYSDILAGWDVQHRHTKTSAGSKKNAKRIEVLWRNPKCMEVLSTRQMSLDLSD